jgi:hypothetical protein
LAWIFSFCFLSIELADDAKQRLVKQRQLLRDEWQEQVDKKQRQVRQLFVVNKI